MSDKDSTIENTIQSNGSTFKRILIKTHVIMKEDDIVEVVDRYTRDLLEPNDIVFISEKATAAAQGRAIPLEEIKPGLLAKFLSNFVIKTKHGIGPGMPETMQMYIQEAGWFRILFAALIGGFCKVVLKKKGVFYTIAGRKAKSIDGPTPDTIPPYNKYVVLSPEDPDKIAKDVSKKIGAKVAIVDINDLEQEVLGYSDPSMEALDMPDILRDNPIGQGSQRTPLGIIRKEETE